MSKEKYGDRNQKKQLESKDDEERFGTKHKQWNHPDLYNNFYQNRYRTCSPVDETEVMGNDDESYNAMHSVEVQTEKSTLFSLRQDKKFDKKSTVQNINKKEFLDNSKFSKHYQTNEFDNMKLKKTGLNYEYDKASKLSGNVNTPESYDECNETDLDQPMDYTLCYNETNLDEEKKRNVSYLPKNDFLCIEEAIEEEKVESIKSKGVFSKESSRNKKEMFSNTSRSFKEIFNFFKDRDKKRSTIENTKVATEGSKLSKPTENCDQKNEKPPQSTQLPTEQEKKQKYDNQCSQQTPLMFSRCSSLGSLNGFEQNSINDDRSSIISNVSRRTSGVVSPSELPDSPAQIVPPTSKVQQKSQIGCFGKKKIQLPQQDKKICQNVLGTNDTTTQQTEGIFKKPLTVKKSVFEDNLTSFKDESTPTKLHSMAASSLSSLTIDDDDDYELMNKILLNKDKQTMIEQIKIENNRQEPIGESDVAEDLSIKINTVENECCEQNEDSEEVDELTDLTPYEEQILDECIRRGIAKWTKRNVSDIKPFSWDVGLTCRATRTLLTNRFRLDSDADFDNVITEHLQECLKDEMITNNNSSFKHYSQSKLKSHENQVHNSYLTESALNLKETYDEFDGNYYLTYEEHLLDQCIRRGMAKVTKRNINDIKPFSWDANQICLTTRAMMLHGRNENIDDSH